MGLFRRVRTQVAHVHERIRLDDDQWDTEGGIRDRADLSEPSLLLVLELLPEGVSPNPEGHEGNVEADRTLDVVSGPGHVGKVPDREAGPARDRNLPGTKLAHGGSGEPGRGCHQGKKNEEFLTHSGSLVAM